MVPFNSQNRPHIHYYVESYNLVCYWLSVSISIIVFCTDTNTKQTTLYTTCTLHYIVEYDQHTVH